MNYLRKLIKSGGVLMSGDKAYLSNDKDMIKFQYGDKIIRFRGAYSLERFTAVKEWDKWILGGNGEIPAQ